MNTNNQGERKKVHYAGYIYALIGFLIGGAALAFLVGAYGTRLTGNFKLALSASLFEIGVYWIAHLSEVDRRIDLSIGKQVLLRDLDLREHVLSVMGDVIAFCSGTIRCIMFALVERAILKHSQSFPNLLYFREVRLALYMLPLKYYYVAALFVSLLKGVCYCIAVFYSVRTCYALHMSLYWFHNVLISCISAMPFTLFYNLAATLFDSSFPSPNDAGLLSQIKDHNTECKDLERPKVINRLHNPRNVAALSFCLGMVSGTGAMLALTFKSFFGMGIYMYFVGQFHLLEYVCLGLKNDDVRLSGV